MASAGFICSLLSVGFMAATLLFPPYTFIAGCILGMLGTVFSISAIKRKKEFALALAGFILACVAIVIAIIMQIVQYNLY